MGRSPLFTHVSSFTFVDFEQVNVCWVYFKICYVLFVIFSLLCVLIHCVNNIRSSNFPVKLFANPTVM